VFRGHAHVVACQGRRQARQVEAERTREPDRADVRLNLLQSSLRRPAVETRLEVEAAEAGRRRLDEAGEPGELAGIGIRSIDRDIQARYGRAGAVEGEVEAAGEACGPKRAGKLAHAIAAGFAGDMQGEIDDPELRSGRHREAGHFQQRGQAGVTAGQPEIDGRRTGREPQRAR
jgi:hypothetical protein